MRAFHAKPTMHLFGFPELTTSCIHVDQAIPKQDIDIQKASIKDLAMDFFTFVDVSPASTCFQNAGKSDGIWGDALYLHLREAMESLMTIRLGSGITCNEGIPREQVSDGKVVVQLLCFEKQTRFRVHANEGAGGSHGALVGDLRMSSPMVSSSLPDCCSTICLCLWFRSFLRIMSFPPIDHFLCCPGRHGNSTIAHEFEACFR
jgi:hypothetical protein